MAPHPVRALWALVATALLLAAVTVLAIAFTSCASPVGGGGAPTLTHGAALFVRHCAGCHGLSGDGETPVCSLLFPRPRAFRAGVFKLVSTQNGVPTDDDLVATLRRGLPGSAMPAYAWLGDAALLELAQHVRGLAIAGMTDSLRSRAALLGIATTAEQVRAEAERRLQPGPLVVVPEPLAAAAVAAADRVAGEQLYRRHCSACHGEDGKGRAPAADWAGVADMVWPRDFTAGFLRGDASRAALTHRVRAGIPGAGMPPTELTDIECAMLIDHLVSKIADGSDGHHVQWRRHLHAARVANVPNDAADLTWNDFEAVRIPLAPLWWRQNAVFEASVRAVHDGDRLVVQLTWSDRTRDDRATGESMQGDGAAMQWSDEREPPQFAMGGSDAVEIWHWKAFRRDDVAGALDLLSHLGQTESDVSPQLPGLTAPSRRGETLSVHGPLGMTQHRGQGRTIVATPVWRDGTWTLQMTRSLAAHEKGEIAMVSGQKLLVAFAVWNGSVDSHTASKSVSTWHTLELDRSAATSDRAAATSRTGLR
jgi:DMSO reductase family type II enzyme heme b subunit